MVGLYAYGFMDQPFDGLCCLSTPFLIPTARDWRSMVRYHGMPLFFPLLIVLAVMGIPLMFLQLTLGIALFQLALLFLAVRRMLIGADPTRFEVSTMAIFKRLHPAHFCPRIIAFIEEKFKHWATLNEVNGMKRLRLPSNVINPLIIAFQSDEALNTLHASLAIGDLPYKFIPLFLNVSIIIWLPIAALAAAPPIISVFTGNDGLFDNYFRLIDFVYKSIPPLLFIYATSVALIPLCYWFSYILRLLPVAIGSSEGGLGESLFIRLAPSKDLPGGGVIPRKGNLRGVINHSVAYHDPRVRKEIAEWIMGCAEG